MTPMARPCVVDIVQLSVCKPARVTLHVPYTWFCAPNDVLQVECIAARGAPRAARPHLLEQELVLQLVGVHEQLHAQRLGLAQQDLDQQRIGVVGVLDLLRGSQGWACGWRCGWSAGTHGQGRALREVD